MAVYITGEYEVALSKLHAEPGTRSELGPPVSDLDVLLETVAAIDGGTRSAIAKQLHADTTASLDAEALVDIRNVLEWNDLVVLDEKTRNPGPKLQENASE